MMDRQKKQLNEAAKAIKSGKLVAFPTETVYGLGGNALSDSAVAQIYAVKGRPSFNPLIVHIHSLEEAQRYVQPTELAGKLAAHFWPGPLTLVMKRKPDCGLSLLVSAGLDSVAIRVPRHKVALELLKESDLPIAAPSANRSGRISPTRKEHVEDEFGNEVPYILEGGSCEVGLESTVVDVTTDKPIVLRPGSITHDMLADVVGEVGRAKTGDFITSPGMLARHYAPNAKVRLNATHVEEGEALLAFGEPVTGSAEMIQNLSQSKNLQEAAANLFAMLRKLDATGVKKIAVMSVPEDGIGRAINDRLRRAATR